MAAKNEQLKRLHAKIKGNKPAFIDIAKVFIAEWLVQNADVLKDFNRQQLNAGLYASGEVIQPYYSAQWEQERLLNGRQIQTVDLNFSGKFYDSIIVHPTLNTVFFDTDDPKIKETKLLSRGKVDLGLGGALGLTQTNATQVGWLAAAGIRDSLMNYLTR